MFASADKNLGPVAVTLEQYIKDGVLHLQDESRYEIISQEEAFAREAQLRVSIKKWTRKHTRVLSKSTKTYLRKKLQETKKKPFGFF